ncbi:flagellar hook-associated protein FlgK [Bacillus sp. Marseille-P3661]|uniref:flagellar hook-associated protein FlgK n=1 Tax=Bacillus sp. Marseille-P3661 TaxID=1936234 RepID=UPI000C83E126|nr:flagellar hook-associated protein FlgK [Bacillus sp. Marseille-P3661]
MVSTFHGLETARRGMMTQQAALYTTGHNIANANTPGYTRQRVNFEQTEPYPPAARNSPHIPGQMGTGVQAGDIQRIRDSFVDMQFRGESSKLGYWEAKAEMLSQMEDIMNEPSETGLATSIDEFWNSLQDLAVQPQNNGARRVVRQRGIALANTFNYMHDSLKSIQKDYRNEIDISQNRINSLVRQINQVNKQIGAIEPHGYLPNDLYDERDRLVDELSSFVNIKTEVKSSGGLSSANAEGLYDVYLATPQGDILSDSNGLPIKLIDSVTGTANGIHIKYGDRTVLDSPVAEVKFFKLKETEEGFVGPANNTDADSDTTNVVYQLNEYSTFSSNGRLTGLIEGYGYTDGASVKGLYNEMLADLDEMAFTFAEHFNLVHSSGWSLNEIRNGTKNNYDFFDLSGLTADNPSGAASILKVSQEIINDVDNIAAASEGNVLAGAMERVNVESATVGNPSIKGVYDRTGSTPNLSADANEIKVDLTFDETSSSWNYSLTSYKSDGTIADTVTGPVGESGKVSIYGVELDTTLVTPANDGSGTQNWTYTFSAQGVVSNNEAFIGNGSNALELSKVKDALINYGGNLTNVHSFYQGMIGTLGDSASEAARMTETATTLKTSVEQRRMSISNVSLDEEMTNMIKFQHAYNGAARMITIVDEMLDKIINGMGLSGR